MKMPNRYEREIEEILSRMEETEPRHGLGDRIRPFQRPAARKRSSTPVHIPFVETLILISVGCALVAGGIAYFYGGPGLISGIIGAVALVLFVVALVAGWRDRFRPTPKSQWRGASYVEVTPIRRGFFDSIATQIRVFRLRMQYRRAQRDNGDK